MESGRCRESIMRAHSQARVFRVRVCCGEKHVCSELIELAILNQNCGHMREKIVTWVISIVSPLSF